MSNKIIYFITGMFAITLGLAATANRPVIKYIILLLIMFFVQAFPKSSSIFNTVPTLAESFPIQMPTKAMEMQIIIAILCCNAILSILLNSISVVVFILLSSISVVIFNLNLVKAFLFWKRQLMLIALKGNLACQAALLVTYQQRGLRVLFFLRQKFINFYYDCFTYYLFVGPKLRDGVNVGTVEICAKFFSFLDARPFSFLSRPLLLCGFFPFLRFLMTMSAK